MLTTLNALGQTYPSAELQRQMLSEEKAFLSALKPTLQHTQMLAVREAMQGSGQALELIRESRNQPPQLPDGINTTWPRPDICLFVPSKPAAHKRPLLLYLHGGGWCFGSVNSCARFCAALALEANCCVAALNYRLSPTYRFPLPLDDCREALAFIRLHASEWGCDSAQVSVGGDSAGGNLALATAMSEPGVSKVISIYPVTKLYTEPTTSWLNYAKGYGNDAELLEAFNEAYAGTETHNPLASVGLASDEALRALPPVLIISAGHDILFDQTEQLAMRLRQLGHKLSYHVYPTATHLFITVPGQPTAFDQAVLTVARFVEHN